MLVEELKQAETVNFLVRWHETYFFLRATTRTRLVCEIAPGVSASLTISACSCWWRLPLPVAGLADSGRPALGLQDLFRLQDLHSVTLVDRHSRLLLVLGAPPG